MEKILLKATLRESLLLYDNVAQDRTHDFGIHKRSAFLTAIWITLTLDGHLPKPQLDEDPFEPSTTIDIFNNNI